MIPRDARILTDGTYVFKMTYLGVFRKTGVIMSSNVRHDGKIHGDVTFSSLVRMYNRLHKESDFKPSEYVTPEQMLRYLANRGYEEKVGWFLRNLGMSRGRRIHSKDFHDRHVCETVHHAMKRWVDLDVRGLHSRYVGMHLQMRLFICTMLCFVFKPYC